MPGPTAPAPILRDAKVLTVSDGVVAGTRRDESGPALWLRLERAGFRVLATEVCPDGIEPVAAALRRLSAGYAGLLLTTGGTGLSPRDLTPEATAQVIERAVPGFAEVIRRADARAPLSRGICGCVGGCLIINLPGSTAGAVESLESVLDLVPHALSLLAGERPH
ncbi:MAG: molybdopterin-binding protein [Actinomycetota bacterium]|nr:molybdopterin-binding protein [Actinomycetota bacterium]